MDIEGDALLSYELLNRAIGGLTNDLLVRYRGDVAWVGTDGDRIIVDGRDIEQIRSFDGQVIVAVLDPLSIIVERIDVRVGTELKCFVKRRRIAHVLDVVHVEAEFEFQAAMVTTRSSMQNVSDHGRCGRRYSARRGR